MGRFVQGADRRQPTLFPECLDDYVAEDNPVRVVDVFVAELDLKGLGFEGMTPAATGRCRPFHRSVLRQPSVQRQNAGPDRRPVRRACRQRSL